MGYVATGRDNQGLARDLWAYDPATDQWTQKADLPGPRRSRASAFVLNGQAYVGCGLDSAGNRLGDFWRYDPGSDSWTRVSDFVSTPRVRPVAFSLNGFGYVGAGLASVDTVDIWRYDPMDDSWAPMQDYPGDIGLGAIAMEIEMH